MKKAQDAWRKKGPAGKMHNIVTYIRSSPQRKEAFKKTVVNEKGNSKSLKFVLSPSRAREAQAQACGTMDSHLLAVSGVSSCLQRS
jgi:hypothetical protein